MKNALASDQVNPRRGLIKPGNSESQGGRGLKLFPGAMSFPFRTLLRLKTSGWRGRLNESAGWLARARLAFVLRPRQPCGGNLC